MKKMLSCLLVLIIIYNCVCIVGSAITTTYETVAVNINDIPLDWEGWYHGFSATRIKRGAEIHISSVTQDGNIIK